MKQYPHFLTFEDYRPHIRQAELIALANKDGELRLDAESRAIAHLADGLRGHFDLEACFSATGDERNAQLVHMACDLAVYFLHARLRQLRPGNTVALMKDEVDKWLEAVRTGKIESGLPRLHTPEGNETQGPLLPRFNSQPKRGNHY